MHDVLKKCLENILRVKTKAPLILTEHPFTDRSALYRIALELVKNRKLHNEMLFF